VNANITIKEVAAAIEADPEERKIELIIVYSKKTNKNTTCAEFAMLLINRGKPHSNVIEAAAPHAVSLRITCSSIDLSS
jgi:hypothetical protein